MIGVFIHQLSSRLNYGNFENQRIGHVFLNL